MNFLQRWVPSHYFTIFAVLSAVLLLAPIRRGDLAGYDDALYAHIAKGVVLSGDWLNIRSNGDVAMEHPPLLVWTEAALFSLFGFSDALAKAPSALAGLGTILLVYWLGRRLIADRLGAALAMFVMVTSVYFLKYSARAMTDVPCTFLFIASICAWVLADDDRRWYLAAGGLVALALMSRGLIGLGLPVIFALDLVWRRKRPPWGLSAAALAIAFLPLTLWYFHLITANGPRFFGIHANWLRNEVYGSLAPAWRRYTGAPEYLWMITKSYWPWLPPMLAGFVTVWRGRNGEHRRSLLLIVWVAIVFLLCAVARSRVLRYMLPAYPAFSILASIGLLRFVGERYLQTALQILTPIFGLAVLCIAIAPPVIWHAADIRPIASAETAVTPVGQRVAFYDEGNPRFDEANQLQWYGARNLFILFTPQELNAELQAPRTDTFVIDKSTFENVVRNRISYKLVAESGNLVCFLIGKR